MSEEAKVVSIVMVMREGWNGEKKRGHRDDMREDAEMKIMVKCPGPR